MGVARRVELSLRTSSFRQGGPMMSQVELNSRVALCRQFAGEDPSHQALWMAEARRWSRLANEKLHDGHGLEFGIVAGFLFAFNRFVGAQHRRPNHTAEMMKYGSGLHSATRSD